MAQEALIESPEVPYLTLLRVNLMLHLLSNLSMKKTRSKTNENDDFDIRKQRITKNPLFIAIVYLRAWTESDMHFNDCVDSMFSRVRS